MNKVNLFKVGGIFIVSSFFSFEEALSNEIEPFKENKLVVCQPTIQRANAMIKRVPLDTGVLRNKPVNIISHTLFSERLQNSFLWNIGNFYNHFKRSFILDKVNAQIDITSNGYDNEQISKLSFRFLHPYTRNQHGHKILEDEVKVLIEMINLVVYDEEIATRIFQDLHEKYLVKLEKNELLDDNATIHAYVKYEGKIFQIWGVNRIYETREECKLNMFTGLSIE